MTRGTKTGPSRSAGRPPASRQFRSSGASHLGRPASQHPPLPSPWCVGDRSRVAAASRRRRVRNHPDAATSARSHAGDLASPIGQSGQRRTFRAGRHVWCESGGRGGVSDVGGGEHPTVEASAASTSGSPSARTRTLALCARRPCDARWNKASKDTPERVSGVPPRGLEMCLAQADSTPMTRSLGIAAVDRQHAVAGRREP